MKDDIDKVAIERGIAEALKAFGIRAEAYELIEKYKLVHRVTGWNAGSIEVTYSHIKDIFRVTLKTKGKREQPTAEFESEGLMREFIVDFTNDLATDRIKVVMVE